MKVIDLLNKIANDNIPKRIKYDDYVYQWNEIIKNYERETDINTTLNWDYIAIECLNEEVEIIEEPQEHKIPEKIDAWDRRWHYTYYKKEQLNQMQDNIEQLRQKYNKIIDYLEEIE